MNYQKLALSAGLYFVGVPIGRARDITLHALDVLASAEVLAAEDTRSLRRLMEIHGVPLEGRKIRTLHDHSSAGTLDGLVAEVRAGRSLAYASEAGMPLIADPGFELARACRDADLPVTCAPGPSAVLTALTLAGLPTDAFHFAGFLPSASAARSTKLEEMAALPATLALYESPKRLAGTLADAAKVLGGGRQAAVCRELTKRFEEVRRGTLSELAQHYAGQSVKGEIVLLIDRDDLRTVREVDVNDALRQALVGHSMRDAVDLVARAHDLPRRKVYQAALALEKGD